MGSAGSHETEQFQHSEDLCQTEGVIVLEPGKENTKEENGRKASISLGQCIRWRATPLHKGDLSELRMYHDQAAMNAILVCRRQSRTEQLPSTRSDRFNSILLILMPARIHMF